MLDSTYVPNPVIEEIRKFADIGWPLKQTPHLKIARFYGRFLEKEKELRPHAGSMMKEFSRLFKKSDTWAHPYAVLSSIVSTEVEEKICMPDGMLRAPLPDIADMLKSEKRERFLNQVTKDCNFRKLLGEFFRELYCGQEEEDPLPNSVFYSPPPPISSLQPVQTPTILPAPIPVQYIAPRQIPAPTLVPVLSKLETERERVLAMREFFQLKSCRPEPRKIASPLPVARPIPVSLPALSLPPPKSIDENQEAEPRDISAANADELMRTSKKPSKQKFKITGKKAWPSSTVEAEPLEVKQKETSDKGYTSRMHLGKHY